MGVVELFSKLVAWTIGIIPTLVKVNRELRAEIRDVVGTIADELQRGLDLAILYLRGAKNIKDEAELRDYLNSAQQKLLDYHSEFKICRGLRDLRARFNELFDPTKHAIEWGNKGEVISLIYELEKDERLVMDELSGLWQNLNTALSQANGRESLHRAIDESIASLEVKKNKIRESARKVIDLH